MSTLQGAVAVVALLASSGLVAQDRSDVLVSGIAAPQYFAVRVTVVDRAVTWYRAAFGLEELDRSRADDGVWSIVNLRNDQLFVEIVEGRRAEDAARPTGFFKVGFHVPDVEVVADRVGRETGERPRVVAFARHGVRILQVRDPDGNIIQLSSPAER